MPYVVTENCQGCRFSDCVAVCPVDCFHQDENMLYINPDECIDCGACEPECPVSAIYEDTELPEGQEHWAEVAEEKCAELPLITQKIDPLPTAEARKAELGF